MKLKAVIALLLVVLAFAAESETLWIPRSVEVIGSEAFSGVDPLTAVVIPGNVREIAPDAFSGSVTVVYGETGSAAERFAGQTGRAFVAADVTVKGVSLDAYVPAGEPFSLLADAESLAAPLSYRFQLEKNGQAVCESDWSSSARAELTCSACGVYDVRAFARNEWLETSLFLPASVTVTEPIRSISIKKADEGAPFESGGKYDMVAEIEPLYADPTAISWRTSDKYIATVDENGRVTCVSPGTAVVYCESTDGSDIRARYNLTVIQGVTKIALSPDRTGLLMGETARVEAAVSPKNAADPSLVWKTDDPSVAVVDQNGVVTPVGAGVVTVTASARNGVSASVTLRVFLHGAPESVSIGEGTVYLNVGEQTSFAASVLPEDAEKTVDWISSNSKIVSVDEDGRVTANSYGSATISAVSAVDASVSASRSVVVLNPNRTLVMPARRTDIAGIHQNLNRIANVKASAMNELEALKAEGKITDSSYNSRRNVVSSAFSMYSFPWMTLNRQIYWKVENSEGGAKDFKPGTVYYGMPYISGTYYKQRLYNVSKALGEKRYLKVEGEDYYVLDQDNLLGGKYCGNDCSSMTAISYFGVGMSGLGDWNTHKFYTTGDFKTLSKTAELYPGDIIVRNYRHVVIFLYYANSEKTQFVIIEQGGNEAAINTISTSVHDASYYFSNEYIPRRYRGW